MRRKPIKRRGRKWPVTKELDQLLRRVVMARDNGTCRRCGKESAPGRGQAIETAHILPKGKYPAMRYRLENVVALCHGCHHYWAHKDPLGFTAWVRSEVGPTRFKSLSEAASKPGRVDREADRAYLEAVAGKWGVLEYRTKRRDG